MHEAPFALEDWAYPRKKLQSQGDPIALSGHRTHIDHGGSCQRADPEKSASTNSTELSFPLIFSGP